MAKDTVATWGSFDGKLHPGHLYTLKECKKYGKVTVFLMSDESIRFKKKREPFFPQSIRRNNLLQTGLVNRVIYGTSDPETNLQITVNLKPDVFCFGDDQVDPWNKELEKRLTKLGTKLIRIDSYKRHLYSTTKLYFGT